ncbi:heat shock protein [Erysiphe necator]|uniref:Putative 30 kDa heat shock protein n=1 Tax=Uncinula necator TaxID=52586 RepID=A0A0B1P053_UNCNE|nr:heat shock protein [Erysiphe necator]KHJ30204.1 putative 30 kda heat shock protein [Erysiphe necator]
MSYSGANVTNDQRAFPPILRLLDEFDQYSRANDRASRGTSSSISYTPKFDIKENQNAYLLYGEFPGVDQKDIDIEFTDASTLTIKGHVERKYESDNNEASKKQPHRVTVEDEEEEAAKLATNVQVKSTNISQEQKEKFWITERSVGGFHRDFAFPVRVDQDNVKASMKNGILSIVVPKLKKTHGRKITIE